MGIYRTTIAGRRKPILVKAKNITEAKDRIVTGIELLNSDTLEEALTNGETVWKDGEDFPLDEPETEPEGEEEAAAETE